MTACGRSLPMAYDVLRRCEFGFGRRLENYIVFPNQKPEERAAGRSLFQLDCAWRNSIGDKS